MRLHKHACRRMMAAVESINVVICLFNLRASCEGLHVVGLSVGLPHNRVRRWRYHRRRLGPRPEKAALKYTAWLL